MTIRRSASNAAPSAQPVLLTVTAPHARTPISNPEEESVPTVPTPAPPVTELEPALLASAASTTSKAPAELPVLTGRDLSVEFADVTQALFLSVNASLAADQVSLLLMVVANLAIPTVLSALSTCIDVQNAFLVSSWMLELKNVYLKQTVLMVRSSLTEYVPTSVTLVLTSTKGFVFTEDVSVDILLMLWEVV